MIFKLTISINRLIENGEMIIISFVTASKKLVTVNTAGLPMLVLLSLGFVFWCVSMISFGIGNVTMERETINRIRFENHPIIGFMESLSLYWCCFCSSIMML